MRELEGFKEAVHDNPRPPARGHSHPADLPEDHGHRGPRSLRDRYPRRLPRGQRPTGTAAPDPTSGSGR